VVVTWEFGIGAIGVALKVEIAALEVRIAALEARIAALEASIVGFKV
jgi:hypothetical protein